MGGPKEQCPAALGPPRRPVPTSVGAVCLDPVPSSAAFRVWAVTRCGVACRVPEPPPVSPRQSRARCTGVYGGRAAPAGAPPVLPRGRGGALGRCAPPSVPHRASTVIQTRAPRQRGRTWRDWRGQEGMGRWTERSEVGVWRPTARSPVLGNPAPLTRSELGPPRGKVATRRFLGPDAASPDPHPP